MINTLQSLAGRARRFANRRRFDLVILAAVFLLAAFFRFWAAPLSSGPDIAQFHAFARVFQHHGLDFYHYADAKNGTFPFWGWGFVYPPIWLLILRLALIGAPSSSASSSLVDQSWRVAMKTPIIMADLAIGALIYWAVPGSRWKKLLFASLWLLHPTGWYESAVFGQFDAIAAAFLLASVIFLGRGQHRAAFLFAGLALMTKQHVLFSLALMAASCFPLVNGRLLVADFRRLNRRRLATYFWPANWRRLLYGGFIVVGIALAFSIPFLASGNTHSYVKSVFSPGWPPGYQRPLVYAFSGSGALLTYLHNIWNWDTARYLHWNMPVLGVVMAAMIGVLQVRRLRPAQAALAGILLFLALSYQVNYQYLVIYIPLALLVAAETRYWGERLFTIGLALLPAVWLWLFNVSFWFWYLEPKHTSVISIFNRIGWTSHHSDFVYVVFAMTLMVANLAYVVLALTRWYVRPECETLC